MTIPSPARSSCLPLIALLLSWQYGCAPDRPGVDAGPPDLGPDLSAVGVELGTSDGDGAQDAEGQPDLHRSPDARPDSRGEDGAGERHDAAAPETGLEHMPDAGTCSDSALDVAPDGALQADLAQDQEVGHPADLAPPWLDLGAQEWDAGPPDVCPPADLGPGPPDRGLLDAAPDTGEPELGAADTGTPPGCTSEADCLPGYFCEQPAGLCGGPGSCARIPWFCDPEPLELVCGCDGQTYLNRCLAGAAGVSVDHPGHCFRECLDADICEPTEYCARPLGQCFGPGRCTPRSTAECPPDDPAACTCAGQTLGRCQAQVQGRNLAFLDACGDRCQQNGDCPPERYCRFQDWFRPGVCGLLPADCGQDNPVCADGTSLPNECAAVRQDRPITESGACEALLCEHDGDCPFQGDPEVAVWCALRDCGSVGVCQHREAIDLCYFQADFHPAACTCDGRIVPDCFPVVLAKHGYCGPRPCDPELGGCLEEGLCFRPEGSCAGPGTCSSSILADHCPPLDAPVCGCDGRTYPNACRARAAGQDIAGPGACPVE